MTLKFNIDKVWTLRMTLSEFQVLTKKNHKWNIFHRRQEWTKIKWTHFKCRFRNAVDLILSWANEKEDLYFFFNEKRIEIMPVRCTCILKKIFKERERARANWFLIGIFLSSFDIFFFLLAFSFEGMFYFHSHFLFY